MFVSTRDDRAPAPPSPLLHPGYKLRGTQSALTSRAKSRLPSGSVQRQSWNFQAKISASKLGYNGEGRQDTLGWGKIQKTGEIIIQWRMGQPLPNSGKGFPREDTVWGRHRSIYRSNKQTSRHAETETGKTERETNHTEQCRQETRDTRRAIFTGLDVEHLKGTSLNS